jgi:hypothetical protein
MAFSSSIAIVVFDHHVVLIAVVVNDDVPFSST